MMPHTEERPWETIDSAEREALERVAEVARVTMYHGWWEEGDEHVMHGDDMRALWSTLAALAAARAEKNQTTDGGPCPKAGGLGSKPDRVGSIPTPPATPSPEPLACWCGELCSDEAAYHAHKEAKHRATMTAPQDAARVSTDRLREILGEPHARELHGMARELLARRAADAERAETKNIGESATASPQGGLGAETCEARAASPTDSPPSPPRAVTAEERIGRALSGRVQHRHWHSVYKDMLNLIRAAESAAAASARAEVERLTRERDEARRERDACEARLKMEKLRGITASCASAGAYAKAWHDLATCANGLADGENGGAFVALLDAFLDARAGAEARR